MNFRREKVGDGICDSFLRRGKPARAPARKMLSGAVRRGNVRAGAPAFNPAPISGTIESMTLKRTAFALLLWAASAAAFGADEGGTRYVSDIAERVALACEQGWGSLGLDTAVKPPDGRPAAPLRLGEKEYAKGLGHHAPGRIAIRCNGKYAEFEALAGVHWQGGRRGSVILEALVDGKSVFKSARLADSDAPVPLKLPLAGARELVLVARDAGDGIACDAVDWVEARLTRDLAVPKEGRAVVTLDGASAPSPSPRACGFALVAGADGPQAAFMEPPPMLALCLRGGETIDVDLPIEAVGGGLAAAVEAAGCAGAAFQVLLTLDGDSAGATLRGEEPVRLRVVSSAPGKTHALRLRVRGLDGEGVARVHGFALEVGARSFPLEVRPDGESAAVPARAPALRDALARVLIEWDWRMQDGIGTPRAPSGFAPAIDGALQGCAEALAARAATGEVVTEAQARLAALRRARVDLGVAGGDSRAWERLWRDARGLRRATLLSHPRARLGSIAFVKGAPGAFSHQLTQYYGRYARPGGGVFILERPGESFRCRELTSALPLGSYQHLDVSFEGDRLLFAYCETPSPPRDAFEGERGRYYHLYEVRLDGAAPRRLTGGAFDDFAPRFLPNGRIVFVSTRRLGWHRCGTPGCENYTLAQAEADGSAPRPISYHETQEWDPAVLNDGRVIYTRWDYVDRHAVYYEQLWSVHPDGSLPAVYYGNNTFNPVGLWEARAVPGSERVIATAGAHHAMTAGSIVLVDVARGVDGLSALERLTPDALFPESEKTVAPGWHAPAGIGAPPPVPVGERRWPGHCYRSPYPLDEDLFLAAYSFDALIGEPSANPVNMWGIYLCDRFGAKELLYRDPAIASLWPMPLRPRPRPPVLSAPGAEDGGREGLFVLQDVHASLPSVPRGAVKRLRILQVLPKSTPGANRPTVGLPHASPGKQVLGTVPVEADGSAFFRAPAGVPLAFQALDERGRALQVMRSLTYLQAGERAACIGCHEPRTTAPRAGGRPLALAREPSAIAPAPDGAKPLSYPLLVQPVLDRACVRCHGGEKTEGGIVLTGAPEGRYTASYNALAPRVSFSAWGGKDGDFRVVNCEPLSAPGFFGAAGSSLMKLLDGAHGGVALEGEDLERLVTWMDANALFYGTFDPEEQRRQQRGERIAGPQIE